MHTLIQINNKKVLSNHYRSIINFMFLTKTASPLRILIALILTAPLTGCAAMGAASTVAQVANFALSAAGITKPADPNATTDTPLKIQASNDLNTDHHNRPFSVVVRVYQLKQSSAFQQAFYTIFLDADKEKTAFGADVISVKEVTLIPGQTFVNTEKVSATADYIGIVALFHAPASARWKLTFPTKELNKKGIALGVSACSITVDSGTTLEYSTAATTVLKSPASCG